MLSDNALVEFQEEQKRAQAVLQEGQKRPSKRPDLKAITKVLCCSLRFEFWVIFAIHRYPQKCLSSIRCFRENTYLFCLGYTYNYCYNSRCKKAMPCFIQRR